jgi:hypothetical protein
MGFLEADQGTLGPSSEKSGFLSLGSRSRGRDEESVSVQVLLESLYVRSGIPQGKVTEKTRRDTLMRSCLEFLELFL